MATNRRQQIQLSSDEQAAFFRERKKAALATIDKDGFPHVVAMNYFATDGALACAAARDSNATLTLVSSSRTSQRPRIITPRSSAYSSPASIISATLGFRRMLTTFCAFPYEVM